MLFWLRDVWRHVRVLRRLKVGTPPVAYSVLDHPFLLYTVLPTKRLQRGKCRHAHVVQSSKYNLHTNTRIKWHDHETTTKIYVHGTVTQGMLFTTLMAKKAPERKIRKNNEKLQKNLEKFELKCISYIK